MGSEGVIVATEVTRVSEPNGLIHLSTRDIGVEKAAAKSATGLPGSTSPCAASVPWWENPSKSQQVDSIRLHIH
jgi:hypothetical protein